jgi:U3 small nucleolar RNA-associated protein 20
VVKDLVFLGRVLKNVSVEGQTDETEEQDSEEESDNQTKLSLLWMIRRMRKIVNVEIVKAPKSTAVVTVRSHCIKYYRFNITLYLTPQ